MQYALRLVNQVFSACLFLLFTGTLITFIGVSPRQFSVCSLPDNGLIAYTICVRKMAQKILINEKFGVACQLGRMAMTS
jgi:hypothetical protein